MILDLVSQYIQAFGAVGLLGLYLVLHLCIGLMIPRWCSARPYLFMLMETIGINLERRLNRETRPQSARFMRGVSAAAVLAAAGYLLGYLVHVASFMPYGWSIELIFLALCIDFMSPSKLVRQVIHHLQNRELQRAVEALQPCLREPLDKADSHALIRKTMECIAVSLNRFLVAPAFWFLAAGSAGLSLYITCAALHQAFGRQDQRRKYFGRGVRIADTLLNIVPALLTAFVLCVSALFVSQSNPLRAVMTLLSQGRSYPDWPIAAMAGGLGVTLCGPVRYSAVDVEERAWIGPKGSSARLAIGDLRRAAMLQYVFFVCIMGVYSILIILEI